MICGRALMHRRKLKRQVRQWPRIQLWEFQKDVIEQLGQGPPNLDKVRSMSGDAILRIAQWFRLAWVVQGE